MSGSLKDQAEALLRDVDQVEARRESAKLIPADRALILRLAAKGTLTQEGIASAVGCSQPTVSRVLALLDTRKEARTILESGAAKLADTVVNTDDPSIALKALGKIDVVRDDKAEGVSESVGPIIIISGRPSEFDGWRAGDRIVASSFGTARLDGGEAVGHVAVWRVAGGVAREFPLPAHVTVDHLPEGVTIDPEALSLLEAKVGAALDVPEHVVTSPRETRRMSILVGTPPPGTPGNPIPVSGRRLADGA